jgi:hypothetical protein
VFLTTLSRCNPLSSCPIWWWNVCWKLNIRQCLLFKICCVLLHKESHYGESVCVSFCTLYIRYLSWHSTLRTYLTCLCYLILSHSHSNTIHDKSTVNEQNDLNRTGTTYHQNLYQHLDKLSNPLLTKKLETTELWPNISQSPKVQVLVVTCISVIL